MNYLAHLYLSGDSEEIKLGNFIGDYVKGNKYLQYPEQVAFGIKLHRRIDFFTDQHADVKECMKLLRPGYGRYSGVVTDIFFDHFLAANWVEYSPVTLRQFSKHAHAVFLSDFWLLPVRVKQFLPFLIQHRRLESYANRNNLLQVLDIMSNRTSLPANSQWAIDVLYQEYDQFEALFRSFFAELIGYVELDFAIKITKPVQAQ
ncbi:MAG TPA: ACP phosphodiesterase [Prolixibacteraceae bacterium]|nr:ACP phosphodiesterase [Prolixibacteraceae bacterium]